MDQFSVRLLGEFAVHHGDRRVDLLDGVDAQLASDLRPLLRAGDLLDRWVERWVTKDRDRHHGLRKMAFAAIAGSRTPESRTS